MGVVGLHDFREHRIEQTVPDRCRIDEEQPIGVGVDAVFQCKVHQHRAAKRAAHQPFRRPRERSGLVSEQEEDLLGESHHPALQAKASDRM